MSFFHDTFLLTGCAREHILLSTMSIAYTSYIPLTTCGSCITKCSQFIESMRAFLNSEVLPIYELKRTCWKLAQCIHCAAIAAATTRRTMPGMNKSNHPMRLVRGTETTGMARTVPSWRGEGNRSFGALCAKRKKPGGQEQRADGSQDSENEESLWQRGPCPLSSLALGEGQGMRGHPSLRSGKPHASASAGQARNQSRIS